jgi:glutamyl/glutaminyl-tRNA synthetase
MFNGLVFEWDKECYASDYFQQLYDWAVDFIKKGKAYVDSQTSKKWLNKKELQHSQEPIQPLEIVQLKKI